MRYKVKEKAREPVAKAQCSHYWIVEMANGPKSRGVCQYCGEGRDFLNVLPGFTVPTHLVYGLVKFVHGDLKSLGDEAGHRLADFRYNSGDNASFFGGEIAEHIVDDLSFLIGGGTFGYIRSPDAYPDAVEVPAAKSGDYGIKSFVPAGTAAWADANFAQGQVKVIVNNNKV